MKTLLIGIGNPGRRDDGLGPALVERVAGVQPPERALVSLETEPASDIPAAQAANDSPFLGSSGGRSPAGNHEAEAPRIDSSAGAIGLFWAYQLNIEDAATIREYDRVIFADAAVEAAAEADIVPLTPAASIAFTTHEMSPASVLALAEELYGKAPAGFLLKIRGAEWDFTEGLSPEGERSLAEAERIFRSFIKELKT